MTMPTLPLWSPGTTAVPASSSSALRPRRRLGRVLLVVVLSVLVLGAVLALLAPTIASGMLAPRVAAAINEQIKGQVRIGAINLGWTSPTAIRDVEVLDPAGKSVARLNVSTPTTLWRVVSERWWTLKNLDVGVVEVAGAVNVVRDAQGNTNLGQAFEPRQPASKPTPTTGSGPSGSTDGLQRVKADIRISNFDIDYTDQAAQGPAGTMGLKALKGGAKVDYARASGGSVLTNIDLTAAPTGAAASGGEPLAIKLDADMSNLAGSGAAWPLPDIKTLKGTVRNVPLTLVDALANMKGALVRDVGPRADVSVDAAVSRQNASAKFLLVSDGARANLDLRTENGVIVAAPATAPAAPGAAAANTISLRSTGFLESVPALRDALAKAAQTVTLDKAPGVEIVIENLRWPLPGAAGAPGAGLAATDLRSSGMVLRVRVSDIAGRVALTQPSAAPASTPPAPARAFRVEPFELVINAPELSRGLTVTGGTRATIDNAPAGEISLLASATGLLDAQGRLRALSQTPGAGFADNLDASLGVRGMSTALLQPLVATAGLALDLPADVGPTLDLNLAAKAGAAQPGQAQADPAGGLPPLDLTLNVGSRNLAVDATARYSADILSTTGNGVNVRVSSATGIINTLLAKPGTPPTLALSGPGALSLNIRELTAPISKLSSAQALAAVKALVNLEVSQLGIALPPAPGTPSAQPVQITRLTSTIRLDGVNPPTADLAGQMTHENQPFDLVGRATLDGVRNGQLPETQGGPIAQLIAFKPTANLELRAVPRSVLNLVAAASAYGTGPLAGTDMPSQISRAVRESIGQSITVKLTTQPAETAQDVVLDLITASGATGASINARVTPGRATVSTLRAMVGMDPGVVNPVLAAAAARPPAPGAAPGPVAPPLQLARPFRLTLSSPEAITIPFKPGTTEPDWAAAADARIVIDTDNDIAINNVPAGTDEQGRPRLTGVVVRGLGADIRAPLGGLAPGDAAKAKRLSATFKLAAARSSDNAAIANINGVASATMAGANIDANVTLADIDTAVVEGLIGKPALLSGALGDKAQATLRIQPQAGGTTSIAADITAPRLSQAKLTLTQDATAIRLTQPATITWRPDASFVNAYLLGSDPGQPPTGARLGQSSPVTIRLNKLVIASSTTGPDGQPTVGPLKPGVFDLDAAIEVPSISLVTPGAPPREARRSGNNPLDAIGNLITGGAARNNDQRAARGEDITTTIEGLRISARQAPGTPELEASITMDKVNGVAAATQGKNSGARIRLANLADARGVIDTKKAVVNLDADLVAFPTSVIDGLARQNGLLAELLGPTVNLAATMRSVSLASAAPGQNLPAGTVEATLSSPRARAQLKGDVAGGTFVQTGPVTLTITEMRRELIDLLSGGLPVIESIQKSATDQPATISADALRLPVDGDLTKLNGRLSVDPGVAQFKLNSALGDLIQIAGGKTEGTVGDKIQPFVVNMNRGVLTYDRFTVPVGSFSLDTRGTVDLVRRQIDVVTYAPLGALSQKAIGRMNRDLTARLSGIDKLTQIPIVTKGPLDNPSTEPDFGLMLKETISNPGKLIDAIGNIINPPKKDPPKKK